MGFCSDICLQSLVQQSEICISRFVYQLSIIITIVVVISFWFNSLIATGGMTEQKKAQRRKTLAKWLKESILRLGPTFIKIGQQFSTRVDILAQEYVDQLSELQVYNIS